MNWGTRLNLHKITSGAALPHPIGHGGAQPRPIQAGRLDFQKQT